MHAFDSGISPIKVYPKKITRRMHKGLLYRHFSAVLFTTAKNWEKVNVLQKNVG